MKLYAISDTYQQAIGRALETEEDAEALTRELSTIMDGFAVKAEAVLGKLGERPFRIGAVAAHKRGRPRVDYR